MQVIRKSEDESLIIVSRAAGYAVSQRRSRWATDVAFRGTEVAEWATLGKELTLDQAEALFFLHTAAQAA